MIDIKLIGHDYAYEIEEIIKLFDGDDLHYEVESILELGTEMVAKARVYCKNSLVTQIELSQEITNQSQIDLRKQSKRLLKMALFKAFKNVVPKEIPWGILTGIRPTKIVHEMLNEKIAEEKILDILTDQYQIQEEKALLLIEIAKRELKILKNTPSNSISLYVGIPFCPTRCLYCSFTSNSVEKLGRLMNPYVDALIKEIEFVGNLIKKNNWGIQTIYIGGGTPTTLEVEQLDKLLNKMNDKFHFNDIQEITLEAGRPDTITREKLELIKGLGIERISINPQTMNDKTLQTIRRSHSSKDIIDAYNLARKVGFENINMDIIAGLPEENEMHIIKTMEEILKLNPENLTVHTMAIKRASKLKEELNDYSLTQGNIVSNMLDIAREYSTKMDMQPYYMYRQKNMLGDFENIGYCKPGRECIYNVQIMEERQTIIALGAGGVSKMVDIEKDRIERIFNVKNVEEYINRIDEMIERKSGLGENTCK